MACHNRKTRSVFRFSVFCSNFPNGNSVLLRKTRKKPRVDHLGEMIFGVIAEMLRVVRHRKVKVNMVGIAQLVKASDCGPEDRGFDSHYPPHTTLKGIGILPVSFKFWDIAKW